MSEKKATQRKYPIAILVGAVSVVLALIGLVTVLGSCVNLAQRLLDNSAEKEQFEHILFPVVMFDPAPVEDTAEMDDLVVLRSSIWSAYVSNMNKYAVDANKRINMPKSDVDVACAKLFGPERTLEHQSFSDYMNTYYFDESKGSYLVPLDGSSVLYTPQVEEISHSGVNYTLRVGYLESGSEWLQTLQGKDYEPTPSKYMIYNLQKVDKHFELVSIVLPEEGAVPGKPVYKQEDPTSGAELQPTEETPPTENSGEENSQPTTTENGTTI